MSNTEPVTPATTTAAPAPNTTAAPTEPTTPQDYEAMYRAEVQERIRERNLYKPVQQRLNNIDEASKAAILDLMDRVAAGDQEAILEWTISQTENLSGKDMAALVAERQAREQRGEPEPVSVPGLTEEQVRKIVADQNAADRNYQKGVDRVAAELLKAGYKHDSPAGETIVRYAVEANNGAGVDLPDAIEWFQKEVEATAMDRARAAAAAALEVPEGAPNGVPVGKVPDGKREGESDEDFRRRSIEAKLRSIDVTA